jgi:two-component sensor histidine kinase
MNATRAAVVVCDLEGRVTRANRAAEAISEGPPAGRPFQDAFRLTIADPMGLLTAERLLEVARGGGSIEGVEATATASAGPLELTVCVTPLHGPDDRPCACVIAMTDISARKAAERQQSLLMGELDHRLKNTLALVLSILGRTQEDTVEAFKSTLTRRIHALAATHTLLASTQWSSLTLSDIVTAELAPYVTAPGELVRFSGLDVQLTPRAAIALGLVFHELAANAAKYGALSTPAGQLSISAGRDGGAALEVEWRESGGPPVEEPVRKGFGRTIIARGLTFAEGGGADLVFARTGLICTLRVPRSDIVARAGKAPSPDEDGTPA